MCICSEVSKTRRKGSEPLGEWYLGFEDDKGRRTDTHYFNESIDQHTHKTEGPENVHPTTTKYHNPQEISGGDSDSGPVRPQVPQSVHRSNSGPVRQNQVDTTTFRSGPRPSKHFFLQRDRMPRLPTCPSDRGPRRRPLSKSSKVSTPSTSPG